MEEIAKTRASLGEDWGEGWGGQDSLMLAWRTERRAEAGSKHYFKFIYIFFLFFPNFFLPRRERSRGSRRRPASPRDNECSTQRSQSVRTALFSDLKPTGEIQLLVCCIK